jgi:predicted dehydrogenase
VSGEPVVLVGCGIWGSKILRHLADLGRAVVVVEPDPGRADRARADGAVDVVPVDRLADVGPGGVVVASPATSHAADVDSVLGLDVPVFCEKPFTTSVADARRLARQGDGRIHVMHIWRYHPGVEALGEVARSGAIGVPLGVRSTRANWTSPRTDTDPVWTLAPHDLTLAIEILGQLPPPRAAVAEVHDGRPVGLWGLCGGGDEPFLVLEASTRFADKRREVRVHGTEGVAVLPGLDADAVELAVGHEAAPQRSRRTFPSDEPLRRELEAWLGFLDGGPPPKSDVHEGVAVVEGVAELRRLAGVGS